MAVTVTSARFVFASIPNSNHLREIHWTNTNINYYNILSYKWILIWSKENNNYSMMNKDELDLTEMKVITNRKLASVDSPKQTGFHIISIVVKSLIIP